MSSPQRVELSYPGNELPLFAHAKNWKKYWVSHVAPFLKGDILEVGAGIGANTQMLRPLCGGRYLCLEPDAGLLAQLESGFSRFHLPTESRACTVRSLPAEAKFDTAVYIDVLEHIEDDSAELSHVAKHIKPGGHIIVLSPAYQFLYSPFDQTIGHYRRYTRSSLLRCTPPNTSVLRIDHLDSLGAVLSLGNRLLLRQSYPTLSQILFWDRRMIPISRRVDSLMGFRVGKSILGVWKTTG